MVPGRFTWIEAPHDDGVQPQLEFFFRGCHLRLQGARAVLESEVPVSFRLVTLQAVPMRASALLLIAAARHCGAMQLRPAMLRPCVACAPQPRMMLDVSSEAAVASSTAAVWYSAGLFVSPWDDGGVLAFSRVARDAILLYAYGHVPIVLYLLWFQAKNGSLQNAWQFGLNKPRGAASGGSNRRMSPPRMMATKKDEPEGFISEQGSAAQYITWTIALGIWAAIFYGIAQHAAAQ